MVIPTLLTSGVMKTTNSKVKQEDLDQYIAIHWILKLFEYKAKKQNPNIHDKLFMFKSLVGSGKTTAFVVEMFRYFFNTKSHSLEASLGYKKPIDFDFSAYDFPDDEYTIENRKKGITPVVKTDHIELCAQPKVVLAKSKAIEIATEPFNPDLELNNNVGFNTGPFKSRAESKSSIIYCTTGVLKIMMKTKTDAEIMSKYEYIMCDECHERSIDLDECFVYVRNFLRRNAGNPSCPIVVCMSATFDVGKYATYFGTSPENSILVEGGAISREFFYLDHDINNIYTETAELAYKLHTENDDTDTYNDMLIFAPGDAEIRKIMVNLAKLDEKKELFVTKLSAAVTSNPNSIEMQNVEIKTMQELRDMTSNQNLKRRISIATPVVETGLTIKTLKYVIDTLLVKATSYSPVHNLAQLLTQPCSQSSAEQRGGRAGRVQFGYIYRMTQESSMSKLEEYTKPDIFTTDMSKVLLDMLYAGIELKDTMTNEMFELFVNECTDIANFKLTNKTENCKCMYTDIQDKKSKISAEKQFLEDIKLQTYPDAMLDLIPTDTYVIARNKLISLGFYGTYVGYLASKINRLSVEAIRMVLTSAVYGANLNDLITIGIFLDTGKQDYKYGFTAIRHLKGKEKDETKSFRKDRLIESVFSKKTIDKHFGGSVTLLTNQFYDDFLEILYIMRWYATKLRKSSPTNMIKEGKRMGINVALIYKFMDCRSQIQESLAKMGIVPTVKEINFNDDDVFENLIRLKKCVHAGYKNNLAYLLPDGFRYKTNTGLIITPTEFNINPKPKKIIYGNLFMKMKPQSVMYEPNPVFITSMDGII